MRNVFKLFRAQGKGLCAVALAALMASVLAFTACALPPVSVFIPTPAPVAPASGLAELSTAIRGVSDYLNNTIPGGSMVVFVNVQSDFEQLSDFIIDELLANAVNDRVFTVVDRQQLDVIRAEQNLQLSGEVDDETALSVGRFLGAQTIVSGRISSFASQVDAGRQTWYSEEGGTQWPNKKALTYWSSSGGLRRTTPAETTCTRYAGRKALSAPNAAAGISTG